MRKPAALALLLAALPLWPGSSFPGPLPDGMPRLQTWEKFSGEALLGDPGLRVRYELYVNPKRPAVYELVRYRVSRADGVATDEHPGLEKVQWHAGTNDFRRFACDPDVAPARPCSWRRMRPETAEFAREVPMIVWIYGAHRRSLQKNAFR